MKTLDIAEARNAFSSLLEDLRLGEESVVFSRNGHPVTMLVRCDSPSTSTAPAQDWRNELGLWHRHRDRRTPPPFHRDPADRLIVAFARRLRIPLLSKSSTIPTSMPAGIEMNF